MAMLAINDDSRVDDYVGEDLLMTMSKRFEESSGTKSSQVKQNVPLTLWIRVDSLN